MLKPSTKVASIPILNKGHALRLDYNGPSICQLNTPCTVSDAHVKLHGCMSLCKMNDQPGKLHWTGRGAERESA